MEDDVEAEAGGAGGDGFRAQRGSQSQNNGSGFYRLDANHSSASIFEDVEMAHDEVGGNSIENYNPNLLT